MSASSTPASLPTSASASTVASPALNPSTTGIVVAQATNKQAPQAKTIPSTMPTPGPPSIQPPPANIIVPTGNNTTPIDGGGPIKKTYKGRSYLVRTGKRGGRYILVKGNKIYV